MKTTLRSTYIKELKSSEPEVYNLLFNIYVMDDFERLDKLVEVERSEKDFLKFMIDLDEKLRSAKPVFLKVGAALRFLDSRLAYLQMMKENIGRRPANYTTR